MKSNIVLIGFMGTGKSSVGRELAKILNKIFIETDEMIEKKAHQTIPEIFREGESHFRDLESQICEQLTHQRDAVISTGGGVVLRERNIEYLRNSAIIILLTADANTIFARTSWDGHDSRPLLDLPNPRLQIDALLQERLQQYQNAADIIISTNNKDISTVVSEILEKLAVFREYS